MRLLPDPQNRTASRKAQVKNQSAKAAKINRQRAELRKSLLQERGAACEACPRTPVGSYTPRPWTELHEVLTRARGGDPTDPDNILCLCLWCHKFVTENEREARRLGLVRGRTAAEHRSALRPWETDQTEVQ